MLEFIHLESICLYTVLYTPQIPEISSGNCRNLQSQSCTKKWQVHAFFLFIFWKPIHVGITMTNHPFGNGLYQLSMVIWGMVYYCYTHIMQVPCQFGAFMCFIHFCAAFLPHFNNQQGCFTARFVGNMALQNGKGTGISTLKGRNPGKVTATLSLFRGHTA